MATEDKDTGWRHVTFVCPVRVMLMDKSTPIAAVTCRAMRDEQCERVILTGVRMLFPVAGGPVKATVDIAVARTNIAGLVLCPEPK